MTATCAGAPPMASTAAAASTAMVNRGGSGQSVRAMPHTAWATTATTTAPRPRSTPGGITSSNATTP